MDGGFGDSMADISRHMFSNIFEQLYTQLTLLNTLGGQKGTLIDQHALSQSNLAQQRTEKLRLQSKLQQYDIILCLGCH